MAYLAVATLSLLIGVAVFGVSLRAGRRGSAAVGFERGEEPGTSAGFAERPGPGYTYLRIATRGPSWKDRILGFLGLMVLLAIGTALLALAIYELGHLINLTIERFLET